MTKQQRLRNAAEEFMVGLVANGFRGPWRWNNLDWELAFYKAWREWPPQQRDHKSFPSFEVGGHRMTSQAREMLWQLKSTSPFHDYQKEPLPLMPRNLTPEEYLEISVDGASQSEWVSLAKAFLTEMKVAS